MTAFGVSPVGTFPPAEDDGFPQFIQWQQGGYDLGGPDADTVDFGPGLVATRGTGESANVITVTAEGLLIEVNGVQQGLVDTLNIGNGIQATIVANVATLSMAVPHFTWRDAPADTALEITDAENGIATTGTTGAQNIVIMGDTGDPTIDLPDGATVLVYQEGAALFDITSASGVILNVRAGLLPASAGQFATVTLIKRRTNEWIACGDLETS
jgi:hypothetical protein